jgi:hypothetical protein
MRRTRIFALSVCALLSLYHADAQDEKTVRLIKSGGRFDNWCLREVKESGIIGGNTEYL